ncbi:MAG: DUF2997 domain-containing protein [Planctomycetaceae bacterium]|nr:DUF2997 domain-containing protein [Planctomycetaceae bacterium]
MNRLIEVIVSPTGQTRVETRGFSGATCRDASRFIEQALGKATEKQLTGEFYRQSAAESVRQQQ